MFSPHFGPCGAGGAEALAAALGQASTLAMCAYQVLVWMLTECQLPADAVAKIEAQLAEMHRIRNLSALLCPPWEEQQEALHGRRFSEWGESAQQPSVQPKSGSVHAYHPTKP